MMVKRIVCTVLAGLGLGAAAYSQQIAVKTNGLYWLTTTPNVGVEVALNNKFTFDLSAAYNPWTFKDDKKMKFWLIQLEARYWLCEKFEGHFVGVHLHGAQYYGGFKEKRYDGYLVGGGLTYGYDWMLSSHWNLEASVGVGYAYLWYKESPRIPCEKCFVDSHKHYVGPTKLGVTVTYLF
jgi:hypothetical protein